MVVGGRVLNRVLVETDDAPARLFAPSRRDPRSPIATPPPAAVPPPAEAR
jgi:hypothetical protein